MSNQMDKLRSLFSATDDQMGKKDDDRKRSGSTASASWAPARIAPPRRTARRLAVVIVFFAIAYLIFDLFRPATEFRDFVPNYPTYDGPGLSSHFDRVWPPSTPAHSKQHHKVEEAVEPAAGGHHSGASREARTSLNLPALPLTLEDIAKTVEDGKENKNVLFVSSSLRSAAALLPLACEMGRLQRNYVHYAVMSRSEMPVQQLRKINGLDDSCRIIFHGTKRHGMLPVVGLPSIQRVHVLTQSCRCSPGLSL